MPGYGPPPGAGAETPVLMRHWTGVNIADDPTFLDLSQLQQSRNLIPGPTFALTKKEGAEPYTAWINGATTTQALLRCFDPAGNGYLYGYVNILGGVDQLQVSVNDATPVLVTSFTAIGARAGMVLMNGTVYVGNGIDPVVKVPAGGTATSLIPSAACGDAGSGAVAAADSGSSLIPGTYSYRWAVYDTSTLSYPFIGPAETVVVSGLQHITFTAPAASGSPGPPPNPPVLTGTQSWHLFLTDVNNPIEFATDQIASGMGAATTFVVTSVSTLGTPVPIPSTLVRKGRFLVSHMGRLFVGGDLTAGLHRNVYATEVLLKGQEQTLFNQADFYPANAFLQIDDDVTGLAVVTISSATIQPTAPLAVFSHSQTWMLIGDILDPNATFFNVSKRIGCVAHATICQTPVGVIFLGPESVYLVQPNLNEPVDIGWPIEPAIRAIQGAVQASCVAVYHQGFYKLCIPDEGGLLNTTEWWLDLQPRVRGSIQQNPSWWGPHITNAPLTAATSSAAEPGEDDIAWGGVAGVVTTLQPGIWDIGIWDVAIWGPGAGGTATNQVVKLQVPGVYEEMGLPVLSALKTARLTGDDPFSRKRIKRVRANVEVAAMLELPVTVTLDEQLQIVTSWSVNGASGGIWDVGIWDVATWGGLAFTEADVAVPEEAQGQAVEVQVEHNDASAFLLRDLELRVQVIPRVVA